MIYPLVRHTKRTLRLFQHGQAVFRQHGKPVGGDHLRYSVVDLRIHMIRPACQHNTGFSVLLDPAQRFAALLLHVILCSGLLLPCFPHCLPDLAFGNVPLLPADLNQAFCSGLLAGKGNERTDKVHFSPGDRLHIVFQVFRVGHDDRAVVVVLSSGTLLPLIKHTGVENRFNPVVDQPLHMPVGKLRRVTFRL